MTTSLILRTVSSVQQGMLGFFPNPRASQSPVGLYIGYLTLLLCTVLLLKLFSPLSSQRRLKAGQSIKLPPAATCKIPFLDHTISMAYGGQKLFSMLKAYCGAQTPIRFRLLGQDLILLSAVDIHKTIQNPHVFSDQKLRARFISNVFGIPKPAADVVGADNSGSGHRPIPGSSVPPERRIVRMQQETAFNFLQSSKGISTFVSQFIRFLENDIERQGIGKSWKEFPDFYTFIRNTSSTAVMNAVCGPGLLKKCPSFVDSFWTFDANVHYLHIKLPKFLIPDAYKCRRVCLDAIIDWKKNAIAKSKHKVYSPEDQWDEIWGLQIMRTRNGLYDKFEEYHSDIARAGSDLGIIWASNDNLIPTAIWFLYHLIRSPGLQERCMIEINKAKLPARDSNNLPVFDSQVLVKQPLLQSVYHEVLRTQVTSFIARDVEQDYTVGDYLLPKGAYAITVPWVNNHTKAHWEERPGAKEHPVEEFWPDRFLVFSESGTPEFSLKGLESVFLPFGIGHHICPGRHFATRAILQMVATFMTAFEFEPLDVAAWETPGMDARSFGYTPFRTTKKLPFKIIRV